MQVMMDGRSGGIGGGAACNAWYKCGDSGDMARECPQGGSRGGNACYKCGETGHMARECNQVVGVLVIDVGRLVICLGNVARLVAVKIIVLSVVRVVTGIRILLRVGTEVMKVIVQSHGVPKKLTQPESNPLKIEKDVGSAWGSEVALKSSWGAVKADDSALVSGHVGGWGSTDSGRYLPTPVANDCSVSDGWVDSKGKLSASTDSWGTAADEWNNKESSGSEKVTSGWGMVLNHGSLEAARALVQK